MNQELTIAPANVGRRVESIVRAWLPQVPRTRLLKWLRKGTLRLNGKKAAPSVRVEEGDVLRLGLKLNLIDEYAELGSGTGYPTEEAAPAQVHVVDTRDPNYFDETGHYGQEDGGGDDEELAYLRRAPAFKPGARKKLPKPDVVYEDADILVVNKPAQLAAHPGIGHDADSLSARLVDYLDNHDAPVGERVGLAQRLDAGVTGLVPCGKHARALKVLMGPPHGPKLEKIYLAIVTGHVADDTGTINLPLRSTDAPRGNVPKVVVDRIAGKPAQTDYVVLARFAQRSLLALRLHTGRTHQIRAHLRAIDHPLLGDPRYGHGLANEWARQSHGVRRPLLHAAFLTMQQPTNQAPLSFAQPLPNDMARLCGGKAVWDSPW